MVSLKGIYGWFLVCLGFVEGLLRLLQGLFRVGLGFVSCYLGMV